MRRRSRLWRKPPRSLQPTCDLCFWPCRSPSASTTNPLASLALIQDSELVRVFNLFHFPAILPPSLPSSLAFRPLAYMHVLSIVGCKLAVIKSNGQYVPMPPSLESAIFPHQPVNRVADAMRALTAILETGETGSEGWPPIKVIAIGNGTAGACLSN